MANRNFYRGGVKPRNLPVQWEFTSPRTALAVAPQFISHPADTSGGSRCRADPGRLMDGRVLHIDGRGYHPALSNGSAQRTHGGGLFLCPRIGADVAARQMVGFPHQPGRGALASRSPKSNRPPLDWLSLFCRLRPNSAIPVQARATEPDHARRAGRIG